MADKTKEVKENPINRIPVKWETKEQYTFVGVKLTKKKNTVKEVYRGYFETSAPAGLKPNEEYCLKIIGLNHVHPDIPQFREQFDVLDFEGDHLRKILAKNSAAIEVERTLHESCTYEGAPLCILVEPVYKSAVPFFEDCANKTVEERLDVLKQYALGCLELQNQSNRLGGKIIVAHRDIKMANGMFAKEGERWVIRLIDFASIRLEGDPDQEETEQAEADDSEEDSSMDLTAEFVASAANTAPEDVWRREGYQPSDKTDVYALGMMLGSLFLKLDQVMGGLRSTPSHVWAKDNGWRDKASIEEVKEKLSCAFAKGLKLDEHDAWMPDQKSWIEQSLKEKHTLKWEIPAAADVVDAIRKLFFDATRIVPEKRIGLRAFIDRLTEIEKLQKGKSAHLPLSVYLFDRTDVYRYKNTYISAVLETYAEECGDARTSRRQAPRALCLSYGRAGMGEAVSARVDALDGKTAICDTADEFATYLRKMEPNVGGVGPYPLNYAICSVGHYLVNHKEQFRFTGKIHLFVPEIPAYDDIARIRLKENAVVDLEGLCKMFNDVLGVMPQIYIHTNCDNRKDSDDPVWYSFEPIIGASSYEPPQREFVHEPTPAPQPPTADPAGPAAQVRRQEEPRRPEERFLTGPGAAYITTRSGHKLYVGQRKEHS